MSEKWEIDWKHNGWVVELFRWLPNGGFIEVRLLYKRSTACPDLEPFFECSVTRRIGKPMYLPWPWAEVPTDPAEVIAMARRLVAQYAEARP